MEGCTEGEKSKDAIKKTQANWQRTAGGKKERKTQITVMPKKRIIRESLRENMCSPNNIKQKSWKAADKSGAGDSHEFTF